MSSRFPPIPSHCPAAIFAFSFFLILAGFTFTAAQNLPPAGAKKNLLAKRFSGKSAESFVDIGAALPPLYYSAAAWGDFDHDNDLDLLLCGLTADSRRATYIFRNDAGNFIDSGNTLAGVVGAAAWGDYDNDGDLDAAITGDDDGIDFIGATKLYRNDNGNFIETLALLPGGLESALAWGDFDNDNDLDLLVTGLIGAGSFSKIYRNDRGLFADHLAALEGLNAGAAAWSDYDNDGDLDLLLTGYDGANRRAVIYRNDDGSFSDIAASLPGVAASAAAWGDYDHDGDWDLLLSGFSDNGEITEIYRNEQGNFAAAEAGLLGANRGAVAWGDYDHDDDLDILLTGVIEADTTHVGKVYQNEGGSFVEVNASLPGARESSAAWGDYDNDGDLDIVLSGANAAGIFTKIFQNTLATAALPALAAPSNLSALPVQNGVVLGWEALTNGTNPLKGITYNLRVGNTPGGSEIVSAMADPGSGRRLLQLLGNASHGKSRAIGNLPEGEYFWSVQAIAPNFAGAPFAPEGKFTIAKSSLTLDPFDVDFGEIDIGEQGEITVAIANAGSTVVNVYALAMTGEDSLEFSFSGDSSFTLSVGEQREVSLSFQPRSLAGKNATFIVYHDGAEGFSFAVLSGAGVDISLPVISALNAASTVNLNSPITVSATVTDNFAMQQVRLQYRQGGQTSFLAALMTNPGPLPDYVATIPASIASNRGVEFYIEALDAAGNPNYSELRGVRVRLPDRHLSRSHAGGPAQTSYRLISFPLDSNDPLATSLLLDDLGAADTLQWRLWDIDPGRALSDFPYREFPTVDNFAPGKAKFLITQTAKTLTSGAGLTVSTIAPFEIFLKPGWNMIASPFHFDIPLTNVRPESLRSQLYAFHGAWQPAPDLLKPWEGYLIKVTKEARLTIEPSEGTGAPNGAFARAGAAPGWQINIVAACEAAKDWDNYVGLAAEAEKEWDRLERFEPPPIGEFVRVAFPRREWKINPEVYTTDFRPAEEGGWIWNFVVQTNIPAQPVKLQFENLAGVPEEFEIRLLDVALNIAQELRRAPHYSFRSGRAGGAKVFSLLAGKTDFMTAHTTAGQLVPTDYDLSQNFPNPFNPSTSIKFGLPARSAVSLKIYDVLGKEIATLLEGAPQEAGYHVAIWQGKDDTGHAAPSGLYFYHLQAGGTVLTKKMILIR